MTDHPPFKKAADALRQWHADNNLGKFSAGHAHEIVAAYFHYNSKAAMKAALDQGIFVEDPEFRGDSQAFISKRLVSLSLNPEPAEAFFEIIQDTVSPPTNQFEKGCRDAWREDEPNITYARQVADIDYKIGYLTTHADRAACRAAYSDGYPISCADLAVRLHVPVNYLLSEIREEQHQTYLENYSMFMEDARDDFDSEGWLD